LPGPTLRIVRRSPTSTGRFGRPRSIRPSRRSAPWCIRRRTGFRGQSPRGRWSAGGLADRTNYHGRSQAIIISNRNEGLAEQKTRAGKYSLNIGTRQEPAPRPLRLTSGDGWSLEMACVGIPTIRVSQTNPRTSQPGKARGRRGGPFTSVDSAKVTNNELRDSIQNLRTIS